MQATLRDGMGPVSGAAAGLALGAVALLAGHSAAAATVTGAAIGLGGYLAYVANGIIWKLKAGAVSAAELRPEGRPDRAGEGGREGRGQRLGHVDL
ncbi:hypothetical protein [Actinoplanes sp. NBRC 103695]|uniref:hypothetical protein n=1 Tax=Actinoplanes sp. NBRC 103695 TaxID=3032202 RepID=UPI0025551B6C|nr:hypothetical protein [Actinoplanes sp. NBRC 103695]